MSISKTAKNLALATSWDVRPLGEVVQPTRPRVKPSEKPHLPFIGMENIEAHTMKLLGTVPAGTMKSSAVHFQPDDVLYGRLRPYLNKVYRPDFEGLCSAEFIVFPKTEGISSRYLQYFLNSTSFASYASHLNAGDRPRVDFEQLSPYPFPVAPYEQQMCIVAEIEKQFSRLDEAIANLKRVKANLKRYKAAVLKAAVEGKLTEDWRKKHPGIEPASKLLERILTGRREKWNGRGKYKEPNVLDTSDLPKLPDIWTWVTWDSVLAIGVGAFKRGPFGSALKKSIFVPSGYKVYEQYCPINDDCSFGRYYVNPEKFEELRSFEVKARDFLISCSGVTLGRITQVPHIFEKGIINQALLRVRLNSKVIDDRYFVRLFRSNFFQRWIFDSSTGSAIPNVKGVKALKAIPIPLPPLVEQQQIVAELERRISVIEELEAAVEANLTRAGRLRQAILQRAFIGEL